MASFNFETHNINVTSLPGSPSQDGTDATGVVSPTGATGIRGWLSGIYNLFNGGSAKVNATLTGSILGYDPATGDPKPIKVVQDPDGNWHLSTVNGAPVAYDINNQVLKTSLNLSLPTGANKIGDIDQAGKKTTTLQTGDISGVIYPGSATTVVGWFNVDYCTEWWLAGVLSVLADVSFTYSCWEKSGATDEKYQVIGEQAVTISAAGGSGSNLAFKSSAKYQSYGRYIKLSIVNANVNTRVLRNLVISRS